MGVEAQMKQRKVYIHVYMYIHVHVYTGMYAVTDHPGSLAPTLVAAESPSSVQRWSGCVNVCVVCV